MIRGTLQSIRQISGELSIKTGCDQLTDDEGNVFVDSNDNILITFPGFAPIKCVVEDISYVDANISLINNVN